MTTTTIGVYPSSDGVPLLIGVRVPKSNITFPKDAQQKLNVNTKLKLICLCVITFGTKIGNAVNVAKAIGVITT